MLYTNTAHTPKNKIIMHLLKKLISWGTYITFLQLDWTLNTSTRKINSRKKTKRAMTISRPPLESFQWGESKPPLTIFIKLIVDIFFQNNFPNDAWRKIVRAELNLPRRTLFCQGLRSFWGDSLCMGIHVLLSERRQADICMLNNIVLARYQQYFSLYTSIFKEIIENLYSWIAHQLDIGTLLGRCHN